MRGFLYRSRVVLSIALAGCLLLATTSAMAVVPAVTGLDSSTHIVDNFHFSDDSPSFQWDAASSLPQQIGAYEAMTDAKAAAVDGDIACVADYTAGLRIMDISEPGTPTLLSTLNTSGYSYGVAVAGDVAYVADHMSGIQAVDISDPAAPALLGNYDTPGYALDVVVAGDVAYIANDTYGLRTVDVSDPSNPVFLGLYNTPDYAWGVDVAGDVAYVANMAEGLLTFDISDPTSPTPLGAYDTPGEARDVFVEGDTAYIADEDEGLQVIDISDPTSPTPLGAVDTPDEAFGVFASGDLAYIADGTSGVHVFDVSDPASPILLGTYDTPGYAYDVFVSGDMAYVADSASGLQVVQVTEVAAAAQLGYISNSWGMWKVDAVGDVAYVAGGDGGFLAFDVTDPGTPVVLDTISGVAGPPFYGGLYCVTAEGDIALVGTAGGAIASIDISDPTDLSVMDQYVADRFYDIDICGDVAYAANGELGLRVLDISDPANIASIDRYDTADQAVGVEVRGDVAYLADDATGLLMFDVSDPSDISSLGSFDTTGGARGLDVAGDTAYIADRAEGLVLLDVSNPTSPTCLGAYDTPGEAFDVTVRGNIAYVADRSDGLFMIDVSDPTAPALIDEYNTPGDARGVDVAGDTAYVTDWDGGLKMFDVADGPLGYSYEIDESAATVPDQSLDTLETSVTVGSVADGTSWFHVLAVGLRGEAGDTAHRRVMIDTTPPVTTSDAVAEYSGSATIILTADDGVGTSQVGFTYYKLDGASTWTMGDAVVVDTYGEHTLEFFSDDNAGNNETPKSVDFTVKSDSTDYAPISGSNRYATAIKTSQATFADGVADCVVIATGTNWPDALGGAALAAAKNGPILLTTPDALSSGIITEIRRLGASEAIILGGTGAVSAAVESALDAELGAGNVTRVWGTNRYKTAEAIAAATVAELGGNYDGTAFVGTGANFPDALAASPIAAAKGWPIFLADPRGNPPVATMSGLGVTDVLICGGTGVVSDAQEDVLDAEFGAGNVDRLAGSDRYSTAVKVASHGVDSAGLAWDGLALSTGENFPDALAGGVLAGKGGSVMLLTASSSLPNVVRNKLAAERDWISEVYYLGGTGAISQGVRDDVSAILY